MTGDDRNDHVHDTGKPTDRGAARAYFALWLDRVEDMIATARNVVAESDAPAAQGADAAPSGPAESREFDVFSAATTFASRAEQLARVLSPPWRARVAAMMGGAASELADTEAPGGREADARRRVVARLRGLADEIEAAEEGR